MDTHEYIYSTLSSINYPVEYDTYTGKQKKYITYFEILEKVEFGSDDTDEIIGHHFQVDVFSDEDPTEMKNEVITQADFERSRNRIYGEMVADFDDVEHVGRIFLSNEIKGINTLDYVKNIQEIDLNYVNKIKNQISTNLSAFLGLNLNTLQYNNYQIMA